MDSPPIRRRERLSAPFQPERHDRIASGSGLPERFAVITVMAVLPRADELERPGWDHPSRSYEVKR